MEAWKTCSNVTKSARFNQQRSSTHLKIVRWHHSGLPFLFEKFSHKKMKRKTDDFKQKQFDPFFISVL